MTRWEQEWHCDWSWFQVRLMYKRGHNRNISICTYNISKWLIWHNRNISICISKWLIWHNRNISICTYNISKWLIWHNRNISICTYNISKWLIWHNRNISICTYNISKWLIWVVSLFCVLYVCVCYTGKHCLHLAFLHLTPLKYFSKKWDFRVRLNSQKESMPRRLWSISFHIYGNLCSGSREVNIVLARLRFARFVFSCLVGLEGSVKYSKFLKLKSNYIFFIWCIKVNILNLYWSPTVNILDSLNRGLIWKL